MDDIYDLIYYLQLKLYKYIRKLKIYLFGITFQVTSLPKDAIFINHHIGLDHKSTEIIQISLYYVPIVYYRSFFEKIERIHSNVYYIQTNFSYDEINHHNSLVLQLDNHIFYKMPLEEVSNLLMSTYFDYLIFLSTQKLRANL